MSGLKQFSKEIRNKRLINTDVSKFPKLSENYSFDDPEYCKICCKDLATYFGARCSRFEFYKKHRYGIVELNPGETINYSDIIKIYQNCVSFDIHSLSIGIEKSELVVYLFFV